MAPLGHQLEKLCAEAQKDVVLTAPFIKAPVLNKLLSQLPDNVNLKCITRWRPEEILAGVSDLEVWSIIKTRPKSSLLLRPDLHAKFYRADTNCLVGSANLTASALGWSNKPNLELLVALPVTTELRLFEIELLAGCIQVDESLFNQMSATVEAMRNHQVTPYVLELEKHAEDSSIQSVSSKIWIPRLRNPEDLYLAYSGQLKRLTTTSEEAALYDLQALQLIPNLPKGAFDAYVGAILLQMPIIRQVDMFVATPQRFGAVRDFLLSLPCSSSSDFNASYAWQTLIRWLRYFLPNRYALSVPNYSEIFYRVSSN